MNAQREMTLDEWCAQLHPEHRVNKELRELRAATDRVFAHGYNTRLEDEERTSGSAPAPSGVPEVSRAIPSQECYSPDQGDSWYDSPEDADILDTLEADHVGATFTLQVSHYAVERTYRVTKVPGDDSDDYEIEEVPATPTQEQPRKTSRVYETEARIEPFLKKEPTP